MLKKLIRMLEELRGNKRKLIKRGEVRLI